MDVDLRESAREALGQAPELVLRGDRVMSGMAALIATTSTARIEHLRALAQQLDTAVRHLERMMEQLNRAKAYVALMDGKSTAGLTVPDDGEHLARKAIDSYTAGLLHLQSAERLEKHATSLGNR